MFKKIRDKTDIHGNRGAYKIEKKASINFFINCVNYNFFKDAKTNVAVIDHSIVPLSVADYLPLFDYVFVKDAYTQSVLTSYFNNSKAEAKSSDIKFLNMGWGSPSITEFQHNKNFREVLLYVPNLRDPIFKQIIDSLSSRISNS